MWTLMTECSEADSAGVVYARCVGETGLGRDGAAGTGPGLLHPRLTGLTELRLSRRVASNLSIVGDSVHTER